MNRSFDVIVVGGGLAGLAAASYLGRAGRKVALFEQSHRLGGRATTEVKDGFHLNMGPHALYSGGVGKGILEDLGVAFCGHVPAQGRFAYGVDGEKKGVLPGSALTMLKTGLLPWRAKIEVSRLLKALDSLDPAQYADKTLATAIDQAVQQPESRRFLRAIFRLATYADIPEQQSASASFAQLKTGLAGVLYLDGGWQTLVDGLRKIAETEGVEFFTNHEVQGIETDGAVHSILTHTGFHSAPAVVLAVRPATALALLGRLAASQFKRELASLIPVRAATLELGLRRLPDPKIRFALGIDKPLYFSVHSAYARLAPLGSAFIHVAKYLGADASDPEADRRELEHFLDSVQPGWRAQSLLERFLPEMVVSNAMVMPSGRPNCDASGVRGVYLAGDWVGPDGMLVDAALASARRAAEMILRSRAVVETLEAMALEGKM